MYAESKFKRSDLSFVHFFHGSNDGKSHVVNLENGELRKFNTSASFFNLQFNNKSQRKVRGWPYIKKNLFNLTQFVYMRTIFFQYLIPSLNIIVTHIFFLKLIIYNKIRRTT